jgi:hypothetical protein
MSDPLRLRTSGDAAERALLESAQEDGPSDTAQRATLVALGLAAPAVALTAGAATAAASSGFKATLSSWLAIGAAGLVGTAVVVAPVVMEPPATHPAVRTERAPVHPEPVEGVEVSAPPAPAPTLPSELERESAALEGALSALDRHAPAEALSLLTQHAADFPKGQLTEEAAALRVEALASNGQTAAARAALAAFRARWPNSPYDARAARAVINLTSAGDVGGGGLK